MKQRKADQPVSVWLALAAALTARRLGVYVTRAEIEQTFGNGEKHFRDLHDFLRNRSIELSAVSLRPDALPKRDYLFPCAAPLANGRALVLLGVAHDAEGDAVTLRAMDPLDPEGREISLSIAELTPLWLGQVVVTRQYRSGLARDRHFGPAWFVPEIFGNSGILLLALVISLLLNALAFTPIVFIQIALDKVIGYKATTTLFVLTGGVAAALVFNAVLGYVREHLFTFIGNRLEARMTGDVFDKLLGLPLHAFQGGGTSSMERAVQGVSTLRATLITRVFTRCFDLTAVVVFLPVLFAYSVELALIVLLFSVLMGASSIALKLYERRRAQEAGEVDRARMAVLRETLSGLPIVKAMAQEDHQRKAWRQLSAASIRARTRRDGVAAGAGQLNSLLQQLMTVSIIFTGVYLVFGGSLSAGSLIAVNMVATRLVGPLTKGMQLLAERDQIAGQIAQIGMVWNAPPERVGAGARPQLMGAFEFNRVGVTFGEDLEALKNVTLSLPARARVAVLGPPGAGKSTLLKLMQGEFPPTQGALDVDGIRVTQYDLPHYRAQVALLGPQPRFFSGTIEENLRRACPNYGKRELDRAFRLSGFETHLPSLPDGLATTIDGEGSQLAGAVRQKLSLARAVLADPRVLLLDESTNGFGKSDLLTFRRNLPEIAAGRTLVMVTQDLAMVTDFDLLVVMEGGTVAGAGRHEALLASNPAYRRLWDDEQALYGTALMQESAQ